MTPTIQDDVKALKEFLETYPRAYLSEQTSRLLAHLESLENKAVVDDNKKIGLRKEVQALTAKADEYEAALDMVTGSDRMRGYPTGAEWMDIVAFCKKILAKHAKPEARGE